MGLIQSHDPLNLALEVRHKGSQRCNAEDGLHGEKFSMAGFED